MRSCHTHLISYITIVILLVLFTRCSTDEDPPAVIVTPTPDPPVVEFKLPEISDDGYQPEASEFEGWTMVFEEDFTDDLSAWTPWESGAYNEELQLYKSQNLYVENGYLYIRSKRGNATGRTNPDNGANKNFSFTSGRIESKETFGPTPIESKDEVRISGRMRLVEGEGMWPAFWTYNDPWPTKGEIDILESRGHIPNIFGSNFHYGETPGQLQTNPTFNGFDYEHGASLAEEFHLYELIWTQDTFEILFDGKVVKTYDAETYPYLDQFFAKKHRIALNLAVGGLFFSNVDESKIPSDAYMIVDWVKVFSK